MITSIKKRDGRIVPFDQEKIEQAIEKSFMASGRSRRKRPRSWPASSFRKSSGMKTFPLCPPWSRCRMWWSAC